MKIPDRFDLEYSITREDIGNGVQEDCFSCPAALAIGRAIERKFSIRLLRGLEFWAHRRLAQIWIDEGFWSADLEEDGLTGWIDEFDSWGDDEDAPEDWRELVEPASGVLHFERC